MTERAKNLSIHTLDRLALEVDLLDFQIQNAERLYEQLLNAKHTISEMHWIWDMIRLETDSEGDAIELAEERCPGIENRMNDICEKLRNLNKLINEG